MAIFRLQENVPDVYPRKSRDFQLLCNAFDAVFNAIKYDIDSIPRTADTRLCCDRLLPLLQTKLGFFSKKHFTTDELRTVLQAFRYVVRDKGSRTGILAAIQVFLKVANASNRSRITIIDNYEGDDGYVTDGIVGNTYVVEVAIEGRQVDTTLLTELLRYVLPAGYQLRYSFYTAMEPVTRTVHRDSIEIAFVDIGDSRGVRLTSLDSSYPYELKFETYTSKVDGEASYYFIKDGDTYTQLTDDKPPHGWPNGEYYKRINDTTQYVLIDVDRVVSPQFENSDTTKYYMYDTGTHVYTELRTIPTNWGESNAVYYLKVGDTYQQVNFSWTLTPLVTVPNDYEKDSNGDYIFYTLDGDSYVETTDYNDTLYCAIRNSHYERVYLQHNSIHGVSTTATHPKRNSMGQLFDYTDNVFDSNSIKFNNKKEEISDG